MGYYVAVSFTWCVWGFLAGTLLVIGASPWQWVLMALSFLMNCNATYAVSKPSQELTQTNCRSPR